MRTCPSRRHYVLTMLGLPREPPLSTAQASGRNVCCSHFTGDIREALRRQAQIIPSTNTYGAASLLNEMLRGQTPRPQPWSRKEKRHINGALKDIRTTK